MAELSGIAGSNTQGVQPGPVRPATPAAGGSGGRGDGGGAPAPTRPGTGDEGQPPVIRFQGQDLDPMAPRGTYLDIMV